MKESLLQKKSSAFICELENGLVLRRAITEDADELAEFNVRVQSNDPDDPVTWIGH